MEVKSYDVGSYGQIRIKLAHFGLAKICQFAQKSQTITLKRSLNLSRFKSLINDSYSTKSDIQCLGEIMNQLFINERYLLFRMFYNYFKFHQFFEN
jgi:hypothetical protein